jgi:hypothetical protein
MPGEERRRRPLESKEPTTVQRESVAVHEDVLKEEVAVKERYVDRHLAVGWHRQIQKRSQGIGGSRKKLAAARRGMTRRAIPAPRKGHGRQGLRKRSP